MPKTSSQYVGEAMHQPRTRELGRKEGIPRPDKKKHQVSSGIHADLSEPVCKDLGGKEPRAASVSSEVLRLPLEAW